MTDRRKTFDVEEAMRILAETDRLIESALTDEEREALARLRRESGQRAAEELYAAAQSLLAPEDFDLLVTADALESLAAKVRTIVKVKEAHLHEKVLDVYRATA